MGPNGAGKSTLIEAISWALYGNRTENRDGKEGIRRSGAGPHDDCWVELEFELGGAQYRLRRSLRGKDLKAEAELSIAGGVVAKTERGVTQVIEQKLGMDYQAFFISVFARQKDLSALSVLTPGERKKLVMRMLELDILQDVVDCIRKDGRDEKLVLQSVNEQLLTADRRPRREVLAEEIALLEAQGEQARKDLDDANRASRETDAEMEIERGRKEWTAAKEEEYRTVERRVLAKVTEIEEARRAASLAEKDLRALKDRLSTLPELEAREEELEEAAARRDAMDGEQVRFEQRKGAAQNLNRVKDELRRTEEALTKAIEEKGKLKGPADSLATVASTMEALESETSGKRERSGLLDSEVKRLRGEIDELSRKGRDISALGPDSMCPTCERQLGEHHHYLISKLEKEKAEKAEKAESLFKEWLLLKEEIDIAVRRKGVLDERKKKLQSDVGQEQRLASTIEVQQRRAEELRPELAACQEALDEIGEVGFDPRAYAELRSRITALRPLAERCKALRGEGARLPDLEARAAEAARILALKEAEAQRARQDLQGVGYQEGDLKAARDAYDRAFHAREAAYGEVSRKASALELANERLADRRNALAEVLEKEQGIAERARKVEQLATLEKVMTDFKQNVMERVVPTLSEISSQFFSEMTDSKYGGIELDEDYEMQIYDGEHKYPMSRFSGGEGDLANLCLRLAISRVLADRSGNDINFLILDEIFGSQDQVRKRNIMATLNRLEKQFQQIILITHIDDTKDLMNNVITIRELEDGTSTVER